MKSKVTTIQDLVLEDFTWMRYDGTSKRDFTKGSGADGANYTLHPGRIFGYCQLPSVGKGLELVTICFMDDTSQLFTITKKDAEHLLISKSTRLLSDSSDDQSELEYDAIDAFINGSNPDESTEKSETDTYSTIVKGSKLCIKGDNNDNELLDIFTQKVLDLYPTAKVRDDYIRSKKAGFRFDLNSLSDRLQITRSAL